MVYRVSIRRLHAEEIRTVEKYFFGGIYIEIYSRQRM
jgi:hypothetical protein